MTKSTTPKTVDITPEGSVVPVYLVPLTEEEEADRASVTAQSEAERVAAGAAEIARATAKESALAKLAKLGLTEEEAKAVIGLD
jgi:hypothetical protein